MQLGTGIAAQRTGRVLLFVWRDDASHRDRVTWFRDRLASETRSSNEPLMVGSLVLPTSDPPAGWARAQIKEAFEQAAARGCAIVHYLVGNSVRVSLGRAFLRGLFLMGRQGDQQSVVGSTPEFLEAIEKRPDIPVARREVIAVIESLCTALNVPGAVDTSATSAARGA